MEDIVCKVNTIILTSLALLGLVMMIRALKEDNGVIATLWLLVVMYGGLVAMISFETLYM